MQLYNIIITCKFIHYLLIKGVLDLIYFVDMEDRGRQDGETGQRPTRDIQQWEQLYRAPSNSDRELHTTSAILLAGTSVCQIPRFKATS